MDWAVLRDWFMSLGQRYNVNPLIFGAIYIGAIPLFTISIAWLVRNYPGWLNDENPDICQNAAIALVISGGSQQVVPLIKALDSEKLIIRRNAAFALGLLNDKRAVSPLIERLQDSDIRVRINAVEALGQLKDSRASCHSPAPGPIRQ